MKREPLPGGFSGSLGGVTLTCGVRHRQMFICEMKCKENIGKSPEAIKLFTGLRVAQVSTFNRSETRETVPMPGTRTHAGGVGLSRRATKASIALLLAMLALIFFFLYAALTAQAAQAQASVPRTAREAARMPQFAARLRAGQNASRGAQSYHLQSAYRNPLRSRQGGALPTDDIVYTNGPINGTTDAWNINFGFIVSDTFPVPSGGASLSALTFGAWLFPGDVLRSVEVSITDSEFGGTTYFDGVVNLSQGDCIGNQYGFNICTESGSFTLNNLAQGTYWVNLQNASVNTGDPVYWDENSGPSLASENSVGTIPSEAFTLLGTTTTTTCCDPPPPPCFDRNQLNVIHDFTPQEGAPGKIVVQNTGLLYGVAPTGGDNGLGLVYRLFRQGQNWIFGHLYNFTGGNQGEQPYGLVIGPDGALYGAAKGGMVNQSCGSSGCGVIYRLRPRPNACGAVSCSWDETVLYQFTGTPDGVGPTGSLVFDQAGNLYGTSGGGAYGAGAVFELTPSHGGWTERVVYSFTDSDAGPNSLVLGGDGNLYGLNGGGDFCWGGNRCGVVYQLVPSHNGWTENVLHSFENTQEDGLFPGSLVQDGDGNLYGTSTWFRYDDPSNTAAILFELSPSNGNWVFTSTLVTGGNDYFDSFRSLAIDPAGNLYTAEASIARYPLWCAEGVPLVLLVCRRAWSWSEFP